MDILERVVVCWAQIQGRYLETLAQADAESHPGRRQELREDAARLLGIVDKLYGRALSLTGA